MSDFNETDSPVMDIQRYLRLISTVYPTVPEIAADGIYGPQTTLAVREFQRANDREATGVVDYDTWELLRFTYNVIQMLNAPSVHGVNFPPDYLVKEGSRDEHAYYIAIMLNRIGKMFNNITDVQLGSAYDENTAKAVKQFQQLAGLEPTGITDKRTWNKMSEVYASYM